MSVHKEFRNVSNTASLTPRKMWSSIYRAIALSVMFSMVLGGLMLTQPQSAGAQSAAVVTDWLNLRTGPSTDHGVIVGLRPGDAITVNGDPQAGFYPVSYGGNTGFAHGDWISIGGSTPPASSNTGNTGTAYVIDGALNLRSGASLNHSVITVMPDGAPVSLTGEAAGGFLGVVYNGTAGWAWAEYLNTSGASAPAPAPSNPAPSTGIGDVVVGSMTTTDALNVRSGPSTSNGIITTIPNGTTVELMGDPQGPWYPVRYAGNKGWSHGDWLTSGGSTTPAPAPAPAEPAPAPGASPIGDTVVGTMYVSTGLNLRQGPSTSNAVITVMPGGATVSVMGEPVNGWYPLTYGGTKGWASGEWLSSTAPTLPAPPAGDNYTDAEIIAIINEAADTYNQSPTDMLRVARCESVLDENAVNPYSNASGLFQFLPGTWATTPFADQDIFDPVANANAAGWMWENGRRNEWVCQ